MKDEPKYEKDQQISFTDANFKEREGRIDEVYVRKGVEHRYLVEAKRSSKRWHIVMESLIKEQTDE